VTSFDGAAVSHFVRAADGSLQSAGCIADAGNFGCAATPRNSLEGAASIVVGPRGRDVYVASLLSGAVTHFARAADGSLRFERCYADGGANGCRKVPVDSLVGASGVALSPRGDELYVASQVGTVASFARAGKTGRLRFASCMARDGKGGCVQPRQNSLRGASGIAATAGDVFVASQASDSLTRLETDRRGRLEWLGCVQAPGRCGGDVPRAAVDGAYAVVAAGDSVYLAAATSGAASGFRVTRR